MDRIIVDDIHPSSRKPSKERIHYPAIERIVQVQKKRIAESAKIKGADIGTDQLDVIATTHIPQIVPADIK